MKIRFWGVRGSLPSPQLSSQIRSKVSAILERLNPEDLQSNESRERFLAELPNWLFGTVGGNTPCLSLEFDDNEACKDILVFDAGSGIRELGGALVREKSPCKKLHIFMSHFHWDHLMGLPFLDCAYDPKYRLDFYSPFADLEKNLNGQMQYPYFPITMDAMAAKKRYSVLKGPRKINNWQISYRKMKHPGDTYAYKVFDGKHSFIYSTDTELEAVDFLKNRENSEFFHKADLLVMDSQYTLGESIEKYNWGHSAFSMAVDFAANWDIKHLVLFHHDPEYDDHKLYNNLQSAKWYVDRMNKKELKLSLATEGLEILL